MAFCVADVVRVFVCDAVGCCSGLGVHVSLYAPFVLPFVNPLYLRFVLVVSLFNRFATANAQDVMMCLSNFFSGCANRSSTLSPFTSLFPRFAGPHREVR